jgi:recombination protein RecA
VGNRVRVRVVKNKVAPPFKTAELDIMFNSGISYTGDLVDLAVNHNVVEKQGAWYTFGDVRLGQGRENAKSFLEANADVAQEIHKAVVAKAVPQAQAPASADGK